MGVEPDNPQGKHTHLSIHIYKNGMLKCSQHAFPVFLKLLSLKDINDVGRSNVYVKGNQGNKMACERRGDHMVKFFIC